MNYTVNLSRAEAKAFQAHLGDTATIQDWVQNAVSMKARKCMDRVILQFSDKQPGKITKAERETIVTDADLIGFRRTIGV